MNEDQLNQVHQFFVGEGYDVGSIDDFRNALQDDKRRSTIHSFFNNEGYEVGKLENFKYQPSEPTTKKDPVPPSHTEPIEDQITNNYTFSWGDGQQTSLATPDFATTVDRSTVKNQENVARLQQLKGLAGKETSREIKEKFSGNEFMQQALATKGFGSDEQVDSFIQTNFQEAPPSLKEALAEYINASTLGEYKRVTSMENFSERAKSQLLEKALHSRLKGLGTDIDVLKARLELQKDPQYPQVLQLNAMKRRLEESGGDTEELKKVEAALEQFSGTQSFQLMELFDQYETDFDAYKGVLSLYPEEAKRRQTIKDWNDAVKISPDDSTFLRIRKNLGAATGAATNAVVDAGINLITFSKGLADKAEKAVGFDVDYTSPSDEIIDQLTSFAETKLSLPELSGLDAQIFHKDGTIKGEAIIPGIAKTVTDMGTLLLGAKFMGGGSVGLISSGMAQQYGGMFQKAKEAGLDDTQAVDYAQAQSFVQGLLELVSPQRAIRGIIAGKSLSNLAKKTGPVTRTGIFKEVLKDVPAENLQEMMQLLAEKQLDEVANEMLGTGFDTQMTKEEIYETALLTTAATMLFGGVSGKSGLEGQKEIALQELSGRRKEFQEFLNVQIEQGNYSPDQANEMWNQVLNYKGSGATEKAEKLLEKDAGEFIQEVKGREEEGQSLAATTTEVLTATLAPDQPKVSPKTPTAPEEAVEEPRVEEEVAQEPEKVQPVVKDSLGERVTYKGKTGTLRQAEDGAIVVDTGTQEIEVEDSVKDTTKTLEELDIQTIERPVFEFTDENNLTLDGVDYTFDSVQTEGGQVTGITLLDSNGQKVELNDPDLALDIDIERNKIPNLYQTEELEQALTDVQEVLVEEGVSPQDIKIVDSIFDTYYDKDIDDILENGAKSEDQVVAATLWADDLIGRLNELDNDYARDRIEALGQFKENVKIQTESAPAGRQTKKSPIVKKPKTEKAVVEPIKKVVEPIKKEPKKKAEKKPTKTKVREFETGKTYVREVKGKEVGYTFEGAKDTETGKVLFFKKKGAKFSTGIKETDVEFLSEFTETTPRGEQKLQEDFDTAQKALKEAWDSFKQLGAIFDPKVQAEKTQKLLDAIFNYAKSWLKLNATKTFNDFKKSIPKSLAKTVSDDVLEAAYNGKKLKAGDVVVKNDQLILGKPDVRKAAKKLVESEELAPEIRDRIKKEQLNYFQEPFAATDAAAEFFISQVGPEKAADLLLKGPDLPGNVQSFIATKLIKILNNEGKKKTGEEKEALYRKAADVAEFYILLGSEAGRTLRAYAGWGLMDPEGVMIWSHRMSSNLRNKILTKHLASINDVIDAFGIAKRQAAGLAIDSIGLEMKNQIELFGYSKKDIKKLKEEAWKKLKAKIFGRAGAGLDPTILGPMAEYGFYSFLDGLRTFKQWSNDIRRAFKDVDKQDLEDAINHIWISEKTQLGVTLQELSTRDVKDLKKFMGTEQLAGQIQKHFGVEKNKASKIADSLNKVYAQKVNQLAKKRAKSKLSALGLSGKFTRAVQKAIEAGNLTKEGVEEALLEQYGFKGITPELNEKLLKLSEEMAKLPEDSFLQSRKAVEIMNLLSQQFGDSSVLDLPISMWYAAILSGPATQVVNAGANIINLIFESTVGTLQNVASGQPNAIPAFFEGMAKGAIRGFEESAAILVVGDPVLKKSKKFFEARPLEKYSITEAFKGMIKAKDPVEFIGSMLGLPPALAKFVPRFMSATDAFFYYGLYEARAAEYARKLVNKRKDLTRVERRELYEELSGAKLSTKEATAKAKTELDAISKDTGMKFTKLDVLRRGQEIIDQSRDKADFRVNQAADDYATRGTYTQKPEGVLGVAASSLSAATEKLFFLKLWVPFTHIVANVLNQQLDYSPLGVLRAIGWSPSAVVSKLKDTNIPTTTPKTMEEKGRLMIKAVAGTTLMVLLAKALMNDDEEDEGLFSISGRGPSKGFDAYGKKKQLYARGWKPYSIKFGNTWVTYQYTPVAFALTIIGNINDAIKYDKVEPDKLSSMIWRAMQQSPNAILEMSFLRSLAEVAEAAGDESGNKMASYMERFGARTLTSPIPNLISSIDKAFDPTVYEGRDFNEKIRKATPFVRSDNKPQLNNFGEPIKRKTIKGAYGTILGLDRFTSIEEYNDPIIGLFADKDSFIPSIGKGTKVMNEPLYQNPDLYYDFTEIVGKSLKKAITDEFELFQELPKENFEKTVKQLQLNLREAVKYYYAEGLSKEEILEKMLE